MDAASPPAPPAPPAPPSGPSRPTSADQGSSSSRRTLLGYGPASFARLGADLTDDVRWEAFRRRFFPFSRLNLNPGTLGPPSRYVEHCRRQFYADQLEAFPLGQYVQGREALRRVRALASALWGHDPNDLAIAGGTTQTLNLLTQALHRTLRDPARVGLERALLPIRVLTTQHEHYGGVAGFEHHPGFAVAYLADDELSGEAFRRRLELERYELVFLSQATYTGGRILEIEALSRIVREVHPEAWLVVDAAQALGLLEPPWQHVDLLVASGHKWLFGPAGSGFLWLSARAREQLQALHWTGEPIDPECGASRFEPSGGQDFSLYAGLAGALELLSALGPEVVAARSRLLAEWFGERLAALLTRWGVQFTLEDMSSRQPGVLAFHFEDYNPYPLYNLLNVQDIHIKYIRVRLQDGRLLNLLRLGFPYYETVERLQRALDVIARLLEAHAHRQQGPADG